MDNFFPLHKSEEYIGKRYFKTVSQFPKMKNEDKVGIEEGGGIQTGNWRMSLKQKAETEYPGF